MVLEEVTNDSQKYTHPVEMLMGKKLKPEVWKTMIQTTAIQTKNQNFRPLPPLK